MMKLFKRNGYVVLDKHSNDIGHCQHFRITHGGSLMTYGPFFLERLAWAPGTWSYVIVDED